MKLEDYLRQEAGIRSGVHVHHGVWWKKTSWGCCQPLYPLQEIPPGSARPAPLKSFIRYSHVVPAGTLSGARTRTRWVIQGDNLKAYSLANIADRKRRQAINKAVRCGFKTDMITELEPWRRDLHDIYVSNAARNRHGLPPEWYVEHEEEWWRNLSREHSLPGRDWFGAFQNGKLVAFLYNCLVDDTAVMLVAKSHRDYLSADPNDLLWFDSFLHYQALPECRRIDAGWAIPVPPTVDWRKRSLGFEPAELPVFGKTNRFATGAIRGALALARPWLNRGDPGANRGWRFKARTIQKRLDELDGKG